MTMSTQSIFRHYDQKENRYTNGLIQILRFGTSIDSGFVGTFTSRFGINNLYGNFDFKVLRGITGTFDAEISNAEAVLLFETKIVSGTLREEQIKRHLENLAKYSQKIKKLILLTPDASESNYIQNFISLSRAEIVHLPWSSVISFFQNYISDNIIFVNLLNEYINEIKDEISEQDIAAVIVKIAFGDKSGVYSESYLDEFKNGEWAVWHTPNEYKELDGKGKKLILYDKNKGLVLEVEIQNVEEIADRVNYRWGNKFVNDSIKIYGTPIPLKTILNIPPTTYDKYRMKKDGKSHGFCNFKKSQTPNWNLTREQYHWLKMQTEGK